MRLPLLDLAFRKFPGSFRANCIFVATFLILLPGAGACAAAEVTLRWADNSSNESGFRVERATGNGSFSQIATTGANVTSYRDTTLAASTTYRYRVRAYNSAGASSYSNTASITTPSSSNTAPTISSIASRTISMNGTTGSISFRISDAQTSADRLTLIRSASNQTLVPLSNIVFGGSGTSRTVTIRPASNRTGWSTIWIKVSDGQLSSYISFVLSVSGSTTNTAPTISAISDRTIAPNGTTGPIPFTIRDNQTASSSLTLIRSASNTSLIPLSGITFGGSGANRTVTIRPAPNRTGWSTIWIKVSDGSLSNFIRFVVNVQTATTSTYVGATSASSTQTMSLSTTSSRSASSGPTSDQVLFDYVHTTGDAELITQVTALASTDDGTRGGLMFRTSTAPDAPCVAVYATGAGRLLLVHRDSTGAALQTVAPLTGRVPRWLRLTRVGDTFYAFTSVDKADWDLVEFAKVPMGSTIVGGMASVSAGGQPDSGTATFAHFTVD